MIITVKEKSKFHKLQFSGEKTVLDVMVDNNIKSVHAPCGGKGVCKKCEVNIIRNHSENPDAKPEIMLSCTTKAEDDMYVELASARRIDFAGSCFAKTWEPDRNQKGYAAAVDIGTSSVILHLVSLENGASVVSVNELNIQRNWGTNVLARLETARDGYAENLSVIIQRQVSEMLKNACSKGHIKPDEVLYMAVSGNSIMEYFFAGLNPAENGISPFVPAELFGKEIDASSLKGFKDSDYKGKIFMIPIVSDFIGGDSLASMLASGMTKSTEPVLLIDLGANAEMILGASGKYAACAADGGNTIKTSLMEHGMTATEGAISAVEFSEGNLEFEVLGKAKPIGYCGSGFIDTLAIMLDNGVVDEMGHIASPQESPECMKKYIGTVDGKPAFFLTEDRLVYITEQDISAFQMGKAAVYAGIKVIAKEYGISISDISGIIMSGGFGTFIRPETAAAVGLIPAELLSNTMPLGNTSIGGTIDAAVSNNARTALCDIARELKYVSLSAHPDFDDYYIEGMMFDL